jgi:hypothetical protein
MTFFGRFRRKGAIPRAQQNMRPVDVAQRHTEALRRRQEAFGSPPLSELEVAMRYGAVEAERRLAG